MFSYRPPGSSTRVTLYHEDSQLLNYERLTPMTGDWIIETWTTENSTSLLTRPTGMKNMLYAMKEFYNECAAQAVQS